MDIKGKVTSVGATDSILLKRGDSILSIPTPTYKAIKSPTLTTQIMLTNTLALSGSLQEIMSITPTLAGSYMVTTQITLDIAATSTYHVFTIYINDTATTDIVISPYANTGTNRIAPISISAMVNITANQRINIRGINSGATVKNDTNGRTSMAVVRLIS